MNIMNIVNLDNIKSTYNININIYEDYISIDFNDKTKCIDTFIFKFIDAFCFAPDTKVIKEDLSVVSIQTLELGDKIVNIYLTIQIILVY